MFCYLIFISYEEFQRQTKERSETDFFLNIPIQNKELLFNPDCPVGIIMDYLIEQVGIPKEIKDKVDLAEENGIFLEVFKLPPDSNGMNIFTYKKKYVMVLNQDDHVQPLISATRSPATDFGPLAKVPALKRHKKSGVLR